MQKGGAHIRGQASDDKVFFGISQAEVDKKIALHESKQKHNKVNMNRSWMPGSKKNTTNDWRKQTQTVAISNELARIANMKRERHEGKLQKNGTITQKVQNGDRYYLDRAGVSTGLSNARTHKRAHDTLSNIATRYGQHATNLNIHYGRDKNGNYEYIRNNKFQEFTNSPYAVEKRKEYNEDEQKALERLMDPIGYKNKLEQAARAKRNAYALSAARFKTKKSKSASKHSNGSRRRSRSGTQHRLSTIIEEGASNFNN